MSHTFRIRSGRTEVRIRRGAGVAGLLVGLLVASLGLAAPAAAAAAPTVTLSGTITGGAADGPVIAGARVQLTPSNGGLPLPVATTNSSGIYTVSDVPVLASGYRMSAAPPTDTEYISIVVSPVVVNPAGDNIVDVALPLGVRIEGTVVLSNGQSMTGATVTVKYRGGSTAATRTVGADGAFTVVGLRPGSYDVRASLAGNSDATATVTDAVAGQTYPVHLTLLSPGVVSGTVTSAATGDPLPGVSVQRASQSAVTDASGDYALAAATIGSYPVTFTDPLGAFVSLTTAPVTVETAQTVDAVNAALEPGAVISGTVLAADGSALPGVLVTSDQFDGELSGLSDFEGHYRIGGVPAGTYTLVGRPQQEPAISTHIETTGPSIAVVAGQVYGAVDFPLDAYTVVSGTLTRSDPLEGDITRFDVQYVSLDELFPDTQTAKVRAAHPDATGHYELRLPPGRYLIRITPPKNGPGYETSYKINWWENIRDDFDYEYPQHSLSSGTKIFVVERNTPATLDLGIDRGTSFTSTPKPSIAGSPLIGQSLAASVGTWTPTPELFRYEWRRDNIPISGASELDYLLTEADLGTAITFAVTGSSATNGVATQVSAKVTPARGLDPTPVPTIEGEPAVGSTLTAVPGTWGPTPVSLAYQWKRDGTVIAGATAATHVVQSQDVAKKISVTVTGSKPGYSSVSQTAPAVTIPVPPATAERISGADRYESAALISQRVAPDGSNLAYVASGENFADALSASAIAAQRGAPLLLSTRSSVPAVVAKEISRLAPSDVVVLGGENALTAEVVSQLNALLPGASVHRISGVDRFEVSRNLILDPDFGAAPSSRLFIATGRNFPDALSATPAAAAANAPVLLVDGQRTAFTAAEQSLLRARGVKAVTTFGGTASIATALGDQLTRLGITVTRITGADRYAVSMNTAKVYFRTQYPRDVVYIASGATFPDALAGGVLAGSYPQTPIFLAQQGCLDQAMIDHIVGLQSKKVVILGGTNSIAFGEFPFPACPRRP